MFQAGRNTAGPLGKIAGTRLLQLQEIGIGSKHPALSFSLLSGMSSALEECSKILPAVGNFWQLNSCNGCDLSFDLLPAQVLVEPTCWIIR
jgi:hypothetical protein